MKLTNKEIKMQNELITVGPVLLCTEKTVEEKHLQSLMIHSCSGDHQKADIYS